MNLLGEKGVPAPRGAGQRQIRILSKVAGPGQGPTGTKTAVGRLLVSGSSNCAANCNFHLHAFHPHSPPVKKTMDTASPKR
jgi:hypothetical protein